MVTPETYRGFTANPTLHHVLMNLSLHGDEVLTHPAADNRGTATLWGGKRGVGRRVLPKEHRGLSGTGKWRKDCVKRETKKGQNDKYKTRQINGLLVECSHKS